MKYINYLVNWVGAIGSKQPIDKLIERLNEEIKLGYYDDVTLRKTLKWAKGYK